MCGCVLQCTVCACLFMHQYFLLQKKKQRKKLLFQGWKLKWNWKLSGQNRLVVSILCQKTRDRKSNYPFLTHTHTHSHAQDQCKETVKDGLPNVLILCPSSFIVDEMNVSLLPLSSLPILAFSCFLAYWAHLLPSDKCHRELYLCLRLSLYSVSNSSHIWSLRVRRSASKELC